MANLTIGVLKKIIENMPDDYTIEFQNKKSFNRLDDKVEIDVSLQKLILKGY